MPSIKFESGNKQAGTSLLISGSAWEHVRGAVRGGKTLDVALKGKSDRYPLYEITGRTGAAISAATI